MRTKYINHLIAILIFWFLFGLIENTKAQTNKPYFENIIIVKFKTEINKEKTVLGLNTFLQKTKILSISKEFPTIKTTKTTKTHLNTIYRLELAENSDIISIIKTLNRLPEVEYAELLYKDEELYTPNDPLFATNQYWAEKIKIVQAWDICKGDTNIVIGIVDSGIDFSHTDLIYNIKYNYNDTIDGIDNDGDGYVDNFRGWNFGENNNNPQIETSNHGVWVSGIAGASTDNNIGVAGAGFLCKILPIKVCNSNNVFMNTYAGIIYAAEHGCKIINCSWGNLYYQKRCQDVINFVTENYDALVVAACGNNNLKQFYYPASYENVLSVAGTNPNDEKTANSNYSYKVDICAPAIGFQTTTGGGGYITLSSGTSFAAPIVSGCAGILRSFFPDYNSQQITELIRISADVIDTISTNQEFAEMLGGGRINLLNALTISQTPSVRFHNFEISYKNNDIIIVGEFTNYLKKAQNLNISLQLNSFNAELENETIFSGNLNTLETYSTNGQIVIHVLESAIAGETAKLKFIYSADDYISTQNIDIILKQEFLDISTDLLTLSVASKGRLGYCELNAVNGNGMIYNNILPLFSECSIIAGFDNNNIFSSSQQISDFKTITYPKQIENSEDSIYDVNIFYEFSDEDDIYPVGLKFSQNIFSKNGKDYNNFFILNYQIKNTTNFDINNFYFGLFTDWDLFDNWSFINDYTNSAVLMKNKNFMYVQNNGQNNMYAGIRLLSNQQVHNYSLPMHNGGDGLIDINNGFSNQEKFHIISSDSYWNEYPTDIAICTSAGPFTIPANDSIKVSFAIIAADNFIDFENAIETSYKLYNGETPNNKIETNPKDKISIFPNITNTEIIVKYFNVCEQCFLEILNSQGNKVLKKQFNGFEKLNVEFLKSGLYYIVIYDKDKILYEKFIKN